MKRSQFISIWLSFCNYDDYNDENILKSKGYLETITVSTTIRICKDVL